MREILDLPAESRTESFVAGGMKRQSSTAVEKRFTPIDAGMSVPAGNVPQFTAAAHKLWRTFPRGLRRQAIHRLIGMLAPPASPTDRLRPGPVVVGGLLSTASGLGEGARLCLDALHELGWNAGKADLSSFFLRPDLPEPLPGDLASVGQGGTLILHINGPYMPYAALRLGRSFLAGRRVIGNWVWELPRMGTDWSRGLRHVHEIWVPSRFTASAMPPNTNVPVKIVPYPVRAPAVTSARDRFGLAPDAFIALTAFDMGSSYVRKNPRAAIAAFRKAFGDNPNCLLLLKVGHSGDANWAMRDMEKAIAGMTNVRIMQETLSRTEMAALVASSDVVLSLHRAEGFGLVPAEAMLLGVPVIATGWSGNMDFMSHRDSALVGYELVPVDDPQGTYTVAGTSWAEADTDEAAAWLARLYADRALRDSLAARARQAASERFSLASYRAAIGDSLPDPGR
jgi:glycosyltransferase involved in cell wall biosynthesis